MWPFIGSGWDRDPFSSLDQPSYGGKRQIGDRPGPDFGSGALTRSQQQGRGPGSTQEGQCMKSRSQCRIGDGSRSAIGPGSLMRSQRQGNGFGLARQFQGMHSYDEARPDFGPGASMGSRYQRHGFNSDQQGQGMNSGSQTHGIDSYGSDFRPGDFTRSSQQANDFDVDFSQRGQGRALATKLDQQTHHHAQPNPDHHTPGMQSHDPDRFSGFRNPLIHSTPHHHRHHQSPHPSASLDDIRLTTSSTHYEPPLSPPMSEQDFALSIVSAYITAWCNFTRASIARCLRAVSASHPETSLLLGSVIPAKRQYLEDLLPRQLREMSRQIHEGNQTQVRQIVDWVRKEKIWEREHGWDEDRMEGLGLGLGRQAEYRYLLPWMEGAKVRSSSSDAPTGNVEQDFGGSGAGGLLFEKADYGSWDFGRYV